MSKRRLSLLVLLPLVVLFLAAGTWTVNNRAVLRAVTGEEELESQIRGVGHLISGRLRPYPSLEPLRPVRHAGHYPFGINTFLQTETEPLKVEQSLDMIAEAGFGWIRQEFTWEDLEIHGENWYVDLRNNEIRNAWAKYDLIVDLAAERDLEIIARLSNPPSWSRAAGDEMGTKAPPDSLETYGDFVEAVVSRYRGRVRYYQIWNEPNCCEEWGRRPVNPEQYVEMLKVAYTRAKAADPDAVILTAPLAPTIELDYYPGGFNDFLFLQRMYDAGAKDYFDVLAVQDYGLWSGPTDRRMRPRVINYSRPEYLRDIMIRNGDGEKAVWPSEIGWNSTPEESGIYPMFGRAPEELRGPYLVEALQRQQEEWPWMGVTSIWFFKQASDEEQDQAQYYFKLVAPDFAPLPAWHDLRAYIQNLEPTLFRGYHQEDHWVLRSGDMVDEEWPLVEDARAIFEQVALGEAGSRLLFHAEGREMSLVVQPERQGVLVARVGEQEARRFTLSGEGAIYDERGREVARQTVDAGKNVLHLRLGALPAGRAPVEVVVEQGEVGLDGIIVE
jgi:polysaccharide biosynthesis protein PslG